jgi:hypothetical protein
METPDVRQRSMPAAAHGLDINLFACPYFLQPGDRRARGAARRMAYWRESLFATMARNADSVADVLPSARSNCVVGARDAGSRALGRPRFRR